MVAINLILDHCYIMVPWKILWRILLTEHGAGSNSPNRSKADLNGARDSTFAVANNVVLSECKCSGLICINSGDGQKSAEIFDSGGDWRSNECESDNCHSGVEENKWSAMVELVGEIRGKDCDEDCKGIWGCN